MIFDRLGLTPSHLVSPDGVCLHVFHRVLAHGFSMVSADRSVAVVIAPICAIEDPRLGSWLSLPGIYRAHLPPIARQSG
ncbi:hypothetical protein [Devosia elaeis]|uniref:hypothetical protein n=1 Tax=Devosia elaeis TaxID=1770058 RepID=UPI001041E83B|nr:hypothetical protein [Devosia elaeis]